MIQTTSIEIYLKEIYPNLTARQRPVLHYLRNAGTAMTDREIARGMGYEDRINEITPRRGELVDKGLVIECGRRRCTVTGHSAKTWKAKYPVLPPAFPEEKKVEINQQQLL